MRDRHRRACSKGVRCCQTCEAMHAPEAHTQHRAGARGGSTQAKWQCAGCQAMKGLEVSRMVTSGGDCAAIRRGC
eukprot:scaffold130051_cov63-Phaeocystis_antarctica.AAC.1